MEQTPHILVVDDDREIRDLLARFLEEKHHMRVTAVRDAQGGAPRLRQSATTIWWCST